MESQSPDARVPDRVLRGAVAALGVAALSVALFVLVSAALFLSREPRTAADAHAMAHSVPAVLVAVLVWTGGCGLAAAVLFAVAYVDRRRLSAVALVGAGSLAAFLVAERGGTAATALALAPVALGGYALYQTAFDRGPLTFLAGGTALLWFGSLAGLVAVTYGHPGLLSPALLVVLTFWVRWLLVVGALAILAVALWYRHLGASVARAPLVLAAANLLPYLPDAVWDAFSGYAVWGLDPLGWIELAGGTAAAVVILAGPLARSVRRRW